VLLGELDAARAVARTVISAASAAGSTQHVAAA